MNSGETRGPDLRTMSPEEMARAMHPGVLQAIEEHRRAKLPLVVWDHEAQRTILVDPEEIAEPTADPGVPNVRNRIR